MPTLMDYEIEGLVKDGSKLDFSKEKLAVHAFVQGKEIAQADVDNSGHYKLTFKYTDEVPATELRVSPAAERPEAPITAADALTPPEYTTSGNRATARLDIKVPSAESNLLPTLGRLIWGGVGTIEANPSGFDDIDVFPGAKMDFAVDIPRMMFQFFPRPHWVVQWTRRNVGYTYTQPTPPAGSSGMSPYSFKIPLLLQTLQSPIIPAGILVPPAPILPQRILRISISQYVNGTWNEVYKVAVPWSQIPQNGEMDFLVPAAKIMPQPLVGVLPSSIGLLPCDKNHLVKGYAFSQPGDPARIQGVSHQPFCETIRIFGLFPPAPPVATYQVQIAATDEDYIAGTTTGLLWEDLTDPLVNLVRDPIKQTYTPQPLGPFVRADGSFYYKNIDTEPEERWHEHGLKFTWNSRNKADGFYAIRMLSFDQNNKKMGEFNLPVLRIDNTVPLVDLQIVGGDEFAEKKCGRVMLTPNGELTFQITAYDPVGHVLSYGLSATAGKNAVRVNTGVESVPVNGVGVQNLQEAIPVHGVDPAKPGYLDSNLQDCDPLAYNVELFVQGSAMDGYAVTMGSQWVSKELNLIVAKYQKPKTT
ncbi:MAG TPA: hypothetical protein VE377_14560 [Candidatus Dormibacteraeota bacterium]|nr:hypothetical protein [Candidatus Dormibacteraeota bacterium]